MAAARLMLGAYMRAEGLHSPEAAISDALMEGHRVELHGAEGAACSETEAVRALRAGRTLYVVRLEAA